MKSLSLFTFSLFLVLLGVRLFSIQSDRFDEIGFQNESAEERSKSVFEMDPKKAKAVLQDLDSFVKRKKEAERKIAEANNEKVDEAEVPLQDQVKTKKILEERYLEFEDALQAQGNNILDIKYMQDDIKRIKEENKIELSNSEVWSAEFILLLVMQEQFSLREINEIQSPEDLGIEVEQWIKMKETAQTIEFRKKIMRFKGIEEEIAEEITEVETIEEPQKEIEPYNEDYRNETISEFQERNERARNGENNDLIAVEPDEYVDEDPSRYPATLDDQVELEEYEKDFEDSETEIEQEYQNYNDGYENEY